MWLYIRLKLFKYFLCYTLTLCLFITLLQECCIIRVYYIIGLYGIKKKIIIIITINWNEEVLISIIILIITFGWILLYNIVYKVDLNLSTSIILTRDVNDYDYLTILLNIMSDFNKHICLPKLISIVGVIVFVLFIVYFLIAPT